MELTHKSQDSGSLAKKKSFKASYGLQKEQKWPIFAVTVATVANFDHFTSFDQRRTPAGAGIMVGPGNDTRDSLFLPPDSRPGVSYR